MNLHCRNSTGLWFISSCGVSARHQNWLRFSCNKWSSNWSQLLKKIRPGTCE